jgi:hypothetical protein
MLIGASGALTWRGSPLEAPSPAAGSWAGPAWLWLGGTMLVGGGGEGGGAGARPGPGLVHSTWYMVMVHNHI